MKKNIYKHNIDLKKIEIKNMNRDEFRKELNSLPYRGYEVEALTNLNKIVIAKPGGKCVKWGKVAKEDFIVFIYNPKESSLWQITHKQIIEDITNKLKENKFEGLKLIDLFERTFNGEEPNDFLEDINSLTFLSGETPETLIKVYKWIWGQEDVNYPNGEGRKMSWDSLIKLKNDLNC